MRRNRPRRNPPWCPCGRGARAGTRAPSSAERDPRRGRPPRRGESESRLGSPPKRYLLPGGAGDVAQELVGSLRADAHAHKDVRRQDRLLLIVELVPVIAVVDDGAVEVEPAIQALG